MELLRKQVLQYIDTGGEVTDEELYEAIDRALMESGKQRYLPLKDKIRYRKMLFDSFRRLDVLSDLLDQDEITEVMVNGTGSIFIEKKGKIVQSDISFSSEEKLQDVVQQIVAKVNRRVNEADPLADARLDDGSRVNIVLPPIALDGPVITIRRFYDDPPEMKQLISWKSISEEGAEFLEKLVKSGYNIFISGGTGSGKTTFLGALAEFIPEEDRVITIEDSAELRLRHIKNLVRLEARAANQEGKYEVTIRDLIRNSLRMRPDRIIVGEIRSGEALDMLQAMNSGHDGSLSTGHANSAKDMLSRIETMVLMSGMELPIAAIQKQIASAIDIIVHLGRLRDKTRKVLSIDEMSGIVNGEIQLHTLYQFVETGEEDGKIQGRFEKTGNIRNTAKLCSSGLLSGL